MHLLGLLLALFCLINPVYATENTYQIYDFPNEQKILKSFNDLNEALVYYRKNQDSYRNLLLVKDDEVLLMEYGFVSFKSNEAEDIPAGTRTISACNNSDAAYLKSSADLKKVSFLLAGYRGECSLKKVTLHPYASQTLRPSIYHVEEGILYHALKEQFQADFYRSDYPLSFIDLPDGHYFSYDCHYFYLDFAQMIDDYRANTHEHAANHQAYYNFYQYLPAVSLSYYDVTDFRRYFYQDLDLNHRLESYADLNADGADDCVNTSMYAGIVDDFVFYALHYGINPLLSFALSMESSAFGKSFAAYKDHNLFLNAAYNNAAEREKQAFKSLTDCLYTHTRFVLAERFLSPQSYYYRGGFLGDFAYGLAGQYSRDPYYGEKVASRMFMLDQAGGFQEYKRQMYALVFNNADLTFYKDKALTQKLSSYQVKCDVFPIIEAKEDVYKVLLPLREKDGSCDYTQNQAYLAKKDVDHIFGQTSDFALTKVNYDAMAGSYRFGKEAVLHLRQGQLAPKPQAYGDKAEFKDYLKIEHDGIVELSAEYRIIADVGLSGPFKTYLRPDEELDLSAYRLRITYSDQETVSRPVNFSMLEDDDPTDEIVTINYQNFKNHCYIARSPLGKKEEIEKIKAQTLKDSVDSKEFKALAAKLLTDKKLYDVGLLKDLDRRILNKTGRNYNLVLPDEDDINIDGLALYADLNSDERFKLIPPAYRLVIKHSHYSAKWAVERLAAHYGFKLVKDLAPTFYRNNVLIEDNFPFTLSLKLPSSAIHSLHTVYKVAKGGKIYKCKTWQSANRLYFNAYGGGDYFILARDTLNTYDFRDELLNLNENNQAAYFLGILLPSADLALLIGFDCLMIILLCKGKRKEYSLWKDYRKLWLPAESVQEEKLKY